MVRRARCHSSWWSTSATEAPNRCWSWAFADLTYLRLPFSDPASGKWSSAERMPTYPDAMRLLKLLSALAAAVFAAGAGGAARPKAHVLAHANPGGGYSADVYAHRGYAYLSSWHGQQCPSLGVRVYDLKMPTRPVRVATFADVASEPDVRGSW